jgi:hypothetical protein
MVRPSGKGEDKFFWTLHETGRLDFEVPPERPRARGSFTQAGLSQCALRQIRVETFRTYENTACCIMIVQRMSCSQKLAPKTTKQKGISTNHAAYFLPPPRCSQPIGIETGTSRSRSSGPQIPVLPQLSYPN